MNASKIRVWGITYLSSWVLLLLISQEHLSYLEENQAIATWESRRHLKGSSHSIIQEKPLDIFRDDQGNLLKFIVFQGDMPGQGAGNILNGLLAAHLLADEFDRILCISPVYEDFILAFDPIHLDVTKYCPRVIKAWEDQMDTTTPVRPGRRRSYKKPPSDLLLQFSNFGSHPVDECKLKESLRSDTPVWYLQTNTYPRWPTGANSIPKRYFEQYYQPKAELEDLLPKTFPSTVVHLRKEDGPNDFRKGLDNQALDALGAYLEGQSPYLVTNHVEYYQHFSEQIWSHPKWESVVHSALLSAKGDKDYRHRQKLQFWADWYTLLQTKTVLHTYSDFSASAVHWKEPTSQSSRIIRGYNDTTNALDLGVEMWRRKRNRETLPLVIRSPEELQHCSRRENTAATDGR